ncbi:MAG TPA: hypothetical protein PLI09_15125 [Candidatus Hydrogenedentes bacterium]|nr:hypothetical protein [Candidatus Hydrogenedentota bacterium]
MEQVIGLIIFIAIVGIANALQRRVEQKRQEMQDQEPKTRVEDLPESTRRQIFGDLMGDIPMAKPKEALPKVAPRQAVPHRPWPGTAGEEDAPSLDNRTRSAEEVSTSLEQRDLDEELAPWEKQAMPWETTQEQAPARRPTAPVRRAAPPRRAPRQPQRAPVQTQRVLTPAEERRKTVESMRQALDESRRQRRGQAQCPGPQPQRRPVQPAAQPQVTSVSREMPQPPERVQQRPAAQQRAGMGFGAGRDPLQRLFCNLDNVRVGIIMHEIMSPPVSMRE